MAVQTKVLFSLIGAKTKNFLFSASDTVQKQPQGVQNHWCFPHPQSTENNPTMSFAITIMDLYPDPPASKVTKTSLDLGDM